MLVFRPFYRDPSPQRNRLFLPSPPPPEFFLRYLGDSRNCPLSPIPFFSYQVCAPPSCSLLFYLKVCLAFLEVPTNVSFPPQGNPSAFLSHLLPAFGMLDFPLSPVDVPFPTSKLNSFFRFLPSLFTVLPSFTVDFSPSLCIPFEVLFSSDLFPLPGRRPSPPAVFRGFEFFFFFPVEPSFLPVFSCSVP